jgi:hypothetical protein
VPNPFLMARAELTSKLLVPNRTQTDVQPRFGVLAATTAADPPSAELLLMLTAHLCSSRMFISRG